MSSYQTFHPIWVEKCYLIGISSAAAGNESQQDSDCCLWSQIVVPPTTRNHQYTKRLLTKNLRLFTLWSLNCLKFRSVCLSRVIWKRRMKGWLAIPASFFAAQCCLKSWWFCGSATTYIRSFIRLLTQTLRWKGKKNVRLTLLMIK